MLLASFPLTLKGISFCWNNVSSSSDTICYDYANAEVETPLFSRIFGKSFCRRNRCFPFIKNSINSYVSSDGHTVESVYFKLSRLVESFQVY